MRAMLLEKPGDPLRLAELPTPKPGPRQLLLHVRACAVCRTDLHVIDGDLTRPKLPLVPGHEIIGTIACPLMLIGEDEELSIMWIEGHHDAFLSGMGENLETKFVQRPEDPVALRPRREFLARPKYRAEEEISE